MKKLTVVLGVVAMLAGCAVPQQIPLQEAYSYDKDTKFAINEESDGFVLTVDYARQQFIAMKTEAGVRECKSKLASIARELSDKTGRKMKPINEERITLFMSPDNRRGNDTYCHAQYKVEWE